MLNYIVNYKRVKPPKEEDALVGKPIETLVEGKPPSYIEKNDGNIELGPVGEKDQLIQG
jgi:hypothetical protein